MKKLNPKSVWLFMLRMMYLPVIILIPFSIMPIFLVVDEIISAKALILAFLVFIILFVLSFWFWSKLLYRSYFYELRKNGFRKEYGVINKKYVSIPYDRIQNVDVHRTLLNRLLNLSDLNIETAGNSGVSGSEGRLPGLSPEVAKELQNDLIKLVKK